MPSRRLNDRIRELCARALTVETSDSDAIFSALQTALHEHNERLRRMAAAKLAGADTSQEAERRSA